MEYKEALDHLKKRVKYGETINGLSNCAKLDEEAINVLEEAVNINTPVKPNLEGDGYADGNLIYDTWVCPNCGKSYEVDYDHYDYCPKCGQHINWQESNLGKSNI